MALPETTNLFQKGEFTLASGDPSPFKIECDALTEDDWSTLAWLLAEKIGPFGRVEGVPTGGLRLAEHLSHYCSPYTARLVIADDVYTTGKSLNAYVLKMDHDLRYISGAVAFARTEPPRWITPLFRMY